MGKRRRKAPSKARPSRVGRLFIGPHTLQRVKEYLPWLSFPDERQLRAWCVKTIYDGVGRQILLFPDRSPSYQQVGQPVIWNEACQGYIILAPDRDGSGRLVARTMLKPGDRQVLGAATEPMPRWYIDFQIGRR